MSIKLSGNPLTLKGVGSFMANPGRIMSQRTSNYVNRQVIPVAAGAAGYYFSGGNPYAAGLATGGARRLGGWVTDEDSEKSNAEAMKYGGYGAAGASALNYAGAGTYTYGNTGAGVGGGYGGGNLNYMGDGLYSTPGGAALSGPSGGAVASGGMSKVGLGLGFAALDYGAKLDEVREYNRALKEYRESQQWDEADRDKVRKAVMGEYAKRGEGISSSLAEAGRGGGSFEKAKTRNEREGIAAANKALVSTYGPSNLDMSAYMKRNAGTETTQDMLGLAGQLGGMYLMNKWFPRGGA